MSTIEKIFYTCLFALAVVLYAYMMLAFVCTFLFGGQPQ